MMGGKKKTLNVNQLLALDQQKIIQHYETEEYGKHDTAQQVHKQHRDKSKQSTLKKDQIRTIRFLVPLCERERQCVRKGDKEREKSGKRESDNK